MEVDAMMTEQSTLRAEIAGLSAHKVHRRYPQKLRERVTAYARRRLSEGASASQVCRELDLGSPTLKTFLQTGAGEPGFAALHVVEGGGATSAVGATRPALTVRGACGVVVEGLGGIDDVAQLLWMLSCLG
jgi:hypothetical protein